MNCTEKSEEKEAFFPEVESGNEKILFVGIKEVRGIFLVNGYPIFGLKLSHNGKTISHFSSANFLKFSSIF